MLWNVSDASGEDIMARWEGGCVVNCPLVNHGVLPGLRTRVSLLFFFVRLSSRSYPTS